MIPYGRHEITQSDIDTVIDVLQNGFLTKVPRCLRLRNRWRIIAAWHMVWP